MRHLRHLKYALRLLVVALFALALLTPALPARTTTIAHARPASAVADDDRPYRERVTGTLASSTLDRNQDGVPASLSTFSGMSNLGRWKVAVRSRSPRLARPSSASRTNSKLRWSALVTSGAFRITATCSS